MNFKKLIILEQTALKELNVILSDEEIKPGDLYLAIRNTGPHLLECKEVKDNLVFPTTGYPYDICECKKVIY